MRIRDIVQKIKKTEAEFSVLPDWVVTSIIQLFIKEIRENLQQGETVSVRGLGKMSFHYNREGKRSSYNFKTKECRMVGCRPKIKFDALFDFNEDLLEKRGRVIDG